MRALFIVAGVAALERFEWVLYVFGARLERAEGVVKWWLTAWRHCPCPSPRSRGTSADPPAEPLGLDVDRYTERQQVGQLGDPLVAHPDAAVTDVGPQ